MRAQRGFSMIEVIIVVALIAFVYTVAAPMMITTDTEVATKVNQLAGDVRSAYDFSVLTGKPYRLVFMLQSGDYWLEGADQEEILLGSEKVDRDPTEAEEKEADAAFDEKYQEYVDLAGEAVVDQTTDKEIPPSSPVLEAKAVLKRPKWSKVENMEWSTRTLGKDLMIVDMQSEHHGDKQMVGELGPDARAMIYFFPAGYVEKAVLHLAYRKGDNEIDTTKEPWTIVTRPYEGVADLVEGSKDVNVHEDGEDDEG